MAFVVDVVSEDSFYENLTLGLIRLLESRPGVKDVSLERRLPCERALLGAWEQRHCCALPADLRHFYASTDGFLLTWSYEYAGEVLPLGWLGVNALAELRRLTGVRCADDCPQLPELDTAASAATGSAKDQQRTTPSFTARCKVFEVSGVRGGGKVCLVFPEGHIWLLDRSFQWHHLADSFSSYFRMMLVHQGLPQWQLRFTTMGLTPWAEQMMVLVAPHLVQQAASPAPVDWSEAPLNHLDPAVLKAPAQSGAGRAAARKMNDFAPMLRAPKVYQVCKRETGQRQGGSTCAGVEGLRLAGEASSGGAVKAGGRTCSPRVGSGQRSRAVHTAASYDMRGTCAMPPPTALRWQIPVSDRPRTGTANVTLNVRLERFPK
ncbi:tubulin polyglutamylase complex subunit 2 [Schistocerca nitens]|uniref:tubulin polyglutamylase complex subunit 2 n=1 Tax=Schistocerca nitens TaxID=7011 RepID=UPI0021184387|nr:tubulin polyglutamylase complex subunit 2 [Schistocerca nitens]